MLKRVLVLLIPLGIAVGVDIGLALVNNIGRQKEAFSWKKLCRGLLKAGAVAGAICGLALVFDLMAVQVAGIEETPEILVVTATLGYLMRGLRQVHQILMPPADEEKKEGQ